MHSCFVLDSADGAVWAMLNVQVHCDCFALAVLAAVMNCCYLNCCCLNDVGSSLKWNSINNLVNGDDGDGYSHRAYHFPFCGDGGTCLVNEVHDSTIKLNVWFFVLITVWKEQARGSVGFGKNDRLGRKQTKHHQQRTQSERVL